MVPREHVFSKSQRLTDATDYKKVFDSAKRSVDNCFLVLARENRLKQARLGMALSKKHIKKAVHRNSVKRLLRESFRLHQDKLKGLDIIVLAQKNTAKRNNSELRRSILAHWANISLCNEV